MVAYKTGAGGRDHRSEEPVQGEYGSGQQPRLLVAFLRPVDSPQVPGIWRDPICLRDGVDESWDKWGGSSGRCLVAWQYQCCHTPSGPRRAPNTVHPSRLVCPHPDPPIRYGPSEDSEAIDCIKSDKQHSAIGVARDAIRRRPSNHPEGNAQVWDRRCKEEEA